MEPLGPRNVFKMECNDVQAALERFENGVQLKTHYGAVKSCLGGSDEDSDDDDEDDGILGGVERDLELREWTTDRDKQRGSNLISFFFQLFKSQQMCDFFVKFGSREIGIHSLVLVEHSDKFYNLLCCQNSGINNITLAQTTTKECIEMVLDYLYTGEIELTEESVDSVVNCATELDLQRLVDKCEEFKRREIESPDPNFRGGCVMRRMKTTPNIQHSDILELDVDTLCTIIADDSILAENEVEIFDMALAWLTYKSTRHIFAKQVLSRVRFNLMTPTELASHVETHHNLMRVPEIKEFTYQAYKYHALKLSRCNNPLLMGFKLKSRKYFQSSKEPNAWSLKNSKSDQRQHAGGSIGRNRNKKKNQCGSKCLHSMECLVNKDEATSTCYNHSALKPSIVNNPMDFVGIQQDVFVFGGTDLQCSDTDLPGRQVLRLSKNVGAKKWELISTLMPAARTNHCAVSIGTIVYIIGGAVPVRELEDNFAQPINTTIGFDSESCEWISCTPMHQSRIYFTAATWKGRIFVFGGQGTGNSVLNSVETYDPAFDRWTQCSSLPTARVGCCSHEFQGKIFVIGGYAWINGNPTALNDVYTYNPITDSYYQLSNLSRGLCYASLTTTKDNMWLFGGAESGCHETQPLISIPHVRVYDSIHDKWKDVSSLTTPRHDCSTVAAGKKIFIVGGLTICNRPLSSVECFDTEKNNLVNNLPDLPCPSAGTSVCIVSPSSHINYF